MQVLLKSVVESYKSLTNGAPCGAEYYIKMLHTAFTLSSTSHHGEEEYSGREDEQNSSDTEQIWPILILQILQSHFKLTLSTAKGTLNFLQEHSNSD